MTIDEARNVVISAVRHAPWTTEHTLCALEMVLDAAKEEGYEEGYSHAQETVGDWNRP